MLNVRFTEMSVKREFTVVFKATSAKLRIDIQMERLRFVSSKIHYLHLMDVFLILITLGLSSRTSLQKVAET